jgi:hypothetical protein
VTQTAANTKIETKMQPVIGELPVHEVSLEETPGRQAKLLRLPWDCRQDLFRAAAIGLLAATLAACSIPKFDTSKTQLMSADQWSSGMAVMATKSAKAVGSLAGMVVDLLGLKSSGALFVHRNQTVQDRLIQDYGLQKVYGTKLATDARTALDDNTSILEDGKVGVISISIADRETKRTAALAESRDYGAKQAGKDAKK